MVDRHSPIAGVCALAALLAAEPGRAAPAQRAPDFAPHSAEARQYAACMALARKTPRAAHDSALAWRAKGGGDAALHCAAIALLGIGEAAQAARLIEDLAARARPDRADLQAGLWSQAGNAWLIARRPDAALAALDKALAIRPDDAASLIDRANARTSLGRDWDALDDLNRALDLAPDRVAALVFRAGAWRRVGASELALQDIDRALALRPRDAEALLERGLIEQALGDPAAARAAWLEALEAAPDGPLAEAARRHIEALDVKHR